MEFQYPQHLGTIKDNELGRVVVWMNLSIFQLQISSLIFKQKSTVVEVYKNMYIAPLEISATAIEDPPSQSGEEKDVEFPTILYCFPKSNQSS